MTSNAQSHALLVIGSAALIVGGMGCTGSIGRTITSERNDDDLGTTDSRSPGDNGAPGDAEPLDEVLTLADQGVTTYSILVAPDATVAERHAADELAFFFAEITGAVLPIQDATAVGIGPAILVGPNPAIAAIAPDLDLSVLGPEELVIETRPPHLILTGGRPRGTLYAVYAFLEEELGCRWWTRAAATIPYTPTVQLSATHRREAPLLEYRDPYWYDAFDPDWAVRNRTNGISAPIDEARGGHVAFAGPSAVHTFYLLAPPETYFSMHPEWYSLIAGARTSQYGDGPAQLCVTNAELAQFSADRAREWLRADPAASVVSVSQNDAVGEGRCQCPVCQAAEAPEGSPSGPLLQFVNSVAAQVETEFPNAAVETLAYQYTRKAPATLNPRPNVIVRLCSIECSFSHPFGDPVNASFGDDLRAWSSRSQRLWLWDYGTNFAQYLLPHPNLRVLAPNLRFFVANGGKGVMVEGNYQSPGGEMAELRSWLLAKLMWNPARDPEALIDEFLAGYFGPAAPALRQYLDLIHDEVAATGEYLDCYSPPSARFLSGSILLQADGFFDRAEAAVAADPALVGRVQVARLPLRYAKLKRWMEYAEASRMAGAPLLLADCDANTQAFFAVARQRGITRVSEARTLDQLEQEPNPLFALGRHDWAPPLECVGLAPDSWQDLQDLGFGLSGEGTWVWRESDLKASDGVAARMPGTHSQWAIQQTLALPLVRANPGIDLQLSLSLRVELSGTAGAAFTYGLWDVGNARSVWESTVSASDIPDGEYHTYAIPAVALTEEMFAWIAPDNNPANVVAVDVDRLWLKK